jgi:hypothetical protein
LDDKNTSTRPRFHAMVVRGQPKAQNPNENKVFKNESWIAFKNSYTLKEPFPNLVITGRLKLLLPNLITI